MCGTCRGYEEGGREGARASGYAVQGRPFWLSSLSGGQLTSLRKACVLPAHTLPDAVVYTYEALGVFCHLTLQNDDGPLSFTFPLGSWLELVCLNQIF